MAVSQLYYRGYYDYVYGQRALGVVTMAVRLAMLVALGVMAARAMKGELRAELPRA